MKIQRSRSMRRYEGKLLDAQLIETATDAEYRTHFGSTRVGGIPGTAA